MPTGSEKTILRSIVVVGALNPRIHHPSWYRYNKLISQKEERSALQSEQSVCTPVFSQFAVPDLAVVCDQSRWEIRTEDDGEETIARLPAIAAGVFGLLAQTPVGAFGFNIQAHLPTNLGNVQEHLAQLVLGLGIGIESAGVSAAELKLKRALQDRVNNIQVQPSVRGKHLVFVAINSHREIDAEAGELFDLGRLIQEHFASDCAAALKEAEQIAARLRHR